MRTACAHLTPDCWVWQDVEVSPFGDTEPQLVNTGRRWTYEDIGVGAFRCTQCGEVGFYTGLWRQFYERDIPCAGSDRLPPGDVSHVRAAMTEHAVRLNPLFPRPSTP